MRILILGGTTFFGVDIVRHLLAQGHAVAVFTRGNTRPDFWAQVEHIQGDREDAAGLADRLSEERFDAVIDNIAYTGHAVDTLLDALKGRIGRYVLTSTASVYHYADPHSPLEEDRVRLDWTPPGLDMRERSWQYAAGKVAAEQATRRGDVPWTIIRPPIVLGPHDPTLRGYWYFQRLLDGGPLVLRDSGNLSFRLAYSDDLARTYALALATDAAIGGVYNICQPEIVTLAEMCSLAAQAYDIPVDIVGAPLAALERAGITGGPYSHMLNFIPSITRAQRELGYTATPWATWLTDTALWYRDSYSGPASAGYDQRAREVEFAHQWRQ